MWAERGQSASYVQDGETLSSTFESLKNNITWLELWQNDDYSSTMDWTIHQHTCETSGDKQETERITE